MTNKCTSEPKTENEGINVSPSNRKQENACRDKTCRRKFKHNWRVNAIYSKELHYDNNNNIKPFSTLVRFEYRTRIRYNISRKRRYPPRNISAITAD